MKKFLFLLFFMSSLMSYSRTFEVAYIKSAVNKNFCIDLAGGVPGYGKNIHCWSFWGGDPQKWVLQPLGRNIYMIRSYQDPNYFIAYEAGAPDGPHSLKLLDDKTWKWNRQGKWYITGSNGWNRIKNWENNYWVWDLVDGNARGGTDIRLWQNNNSNAQLWYFERVGYTDIWWL